MRLYLSFAFNATNTSDFFPYFYLFWLKKASKKFSITTLEILKKNDLLQEVSINSHPRTI